ncbi:MAG: hypothetical protein ACNA8W_06605 [Bradymonadaceae bacterium]
MAEGIHYLVGELDRIGEQLRHDTIYAPALRVIIRDHLPEQARPQIEKILSGEVVAWDRAPLREESWEIYAALTGFYSQAMRLLCKDVTLDVWPGWMRSQWITLDWNPLSRDFGWKVACRPFRGIFFAEEEPEIEEILSYVSSWPHGWLTHSECRDFAPSLHLLLVELGGRLPLDWPPGQLDKLLAHPEKLSRGERFELHNACLGIDAPFAWQFQRALVLLGAMRVALDAGRDLVAVGY